MVWGWSQTGRRKTIDDRPRGHTTHGFKVQSIPTTKTRALFLGGGGGEGREYIIIIIEIKPINI